MPESIHAKVVNKIARLKPGELIFPGDFKEFGNQDAVKVALYRLEKEKTIERIAHGIYNIPRRDPVLGTLYPSLEEIAEAIAKRDKARIIPSGATALHKLGLSTQIPTKLVYLTDGAPRQIQIGKRTIKFKASTPKKLITRGPISGLVIQAFSELGHAGVTPEIESKIKAALQKEDANAIKHDVMLAPDWIAKKILFLYYSKSQQ